MLITKILLTLFALVIASSGIYLGTKKMHKAIMIFSILFSIALILVTWLTIK